MSDEIWKAIPGFEGSYEVSDQGRVRSLDRCVMRNSRWGPIMRRYHGCVLSPLTNHARGGYRYVNLSVDGVQTLRRVCVLVAAAFIGPKPDGMETRHLNGQAADDRLANLVYGTHRENISDKIAHGTHQVGEAVPVSRLKEHQVREILSSRMSANVIAAKFGVHPGHINNIRRGVRWAHVRMSN